MSTMRLTRAALKRAAAEAPEAGLEALGFVGLAVPMPVSKKRGVKREVEEAEEVAVAASGHSDSVSHSEVGEPHRDPRVGQAKARGRTKVSGGPRRAV